MQPARARTPSRTSQAEFVCSVQNSMAGVPPTVCAFLVPVKNQHENTDVAF